MVDVSCNCIICANEFDPDKLESVALSNVNTTNFKVCQACWDMSDPSDDYREVRDIINNYVTFSKARSLYYEASSILKKMAFKKN